MATLDILRAARAKIADEVHWTQRAFARDVDGRKVESHDASAVRWCAKGAIACAARGRDSVYIEAVMMLDIDVDGIAHFNDRPTTKHADVLAAFDRAIAKLESEKGAV